MGKGSSQKVYDFYMSIALGVCVGPINSFNFIRMKEKMASATQVTSETLGLVLDKKKLFGGDKGEGGPRGYVDYHMGSYSQSVSSTHASKHGLAASNLPGYRGLAYLFFYGRGGGTIGFRWTTNSGYFPEIAVGVTRLPESGTVPNVIWPIVGVDELTGDYLIASSGDAHLPDDDVDRGALPDANPAAMIYEALVADWGKRELPGSIDTQSFIDAANTLATENFGLSLIFSQQAPVDEFIGEVLDHIRAMLFEHPVTGLWTLNLIRDDYTLATTPIYDPSNATLEMIKTRTWGDTINEIVVSYTNPANEKAETVSAMNYANITIQGGVRTEERDYGGIRNPWLAQEVAERDVYEASRTLVSARLKIRRGADAVLPGSVIRLTWPEENLVELPCRVMKIGRGNSKDRSIVIDVVEDVFATKRPISWRAVQGGPDEDNRTPEDLDRVFIMSLPGSMLPGVGLSATDAGAAHPSAVVAFIGASTTTQPFEIDAYSSGVEVANFLPSAVPVALGVTLTQETRSTIPGSVVEALLGLDASLYDVLAIGENEELHELVALESYDDLADEWTVIRALYDTQPLEWADTSLVWSANILDDQVDRSEPIVGVTETYTFLPTVAGKTLDVLDATEHEYTPTARASAPFRPANCQIDGNGFGEAFYTELTVPLTIPMTWENRNRMAEDSVPMAWDGGNVTPETGQTTTLRFITATGTIAFEVNDLTGTSYDLDPAELTIARIFIAQFISVRDGIECVQPVERTLTLPNNVGWNYNWNNVWN